MLRSLVIDWTDHNRSLRLCLALRTMNFAYCFMLLAGFTGTGLAQSQNTLYDQDILKLQKGISYRLEDANANTFDAVKKVAFDKMPEADPNFGWTTSVYWFRIEINKQNDQPYIFEIGYPRYACKLTLMSFEALFFVEDIG